MRTGITVALTLFCANTVAAQGGGTTAATTGQKTGSVDSAITQLADAYVKATLAGDAKAIAALYTEDAVEMPPNAASIKGREAILQYYQKVFSGGTKFGQFTVSHLEARATGDSGFDVGTYQQSMNPPGQTAASTDTGKYVVIVKRSQGAWKVAYAIYNSDQPSTGR